MSDVGIGDLADEIKRSDTPELSLRLATVESIEATTVTIRVAGSTNTASGVDYVGYAPKVNDVVLVFQNGPNLIIWGIPGSTGGVPTGTIVAFGSVTPPPGYLLCNGQSTSGFAALAAVVGGTVPDLRGKFIPGAGGAYAVGATGGTDTITTAVAHTHSGVVHTHSQTAHTHAGFNHNHATPAHSHLINSSRYTFNSSHTHAGAGGGLAEGSNPQDGQSGSLPATSTDGAGTTGSDGSAYTTGSGGGGDTGSGGGGTTGSTGSASVDNRPPYYALAYIIKT